LQLVGLAQRVVQYPAPWLSLMQYWGCPAAFGGQSWSSVHGAQYRRGKQACRVGPKVRLSVVTFGC
jgi:hypothetical protein